MPSSNISYYISVLCASVVTSIPWRPADATTEWSAIETKLSNLDLASRNTALRRLFLIIIMPHDLNSVLLQALFVTNVFPYQLFVSHSLRILDKPTRDGHGTSILIWLGTEDITDRRIVG
jgi:hypothetical protein